MIKVAFLGLAYLTLGSGSEQYQGRVLAVMPRSLTLTTSTFQCSFQVTTETKITLDGEEAQLGDLLVGTSVSVTATPTEQDPIARKIEARTVVSSVDGNGDLAQQRSFRR